MDPIKEEAILQEIKIVRAIKAKNLEELAEIRAAYKETWVRQKQLLEAESNKVMVVKRSEETEAVYQQIREDHGFRY